MKLLICITILSACFNKSLSQKLFGQKNTIEITQKWFFESSEFKKNDRKEINVFDKNGQLIRDIQFGFVHNADINLIGQITNYDYQNNKLVSRKTYSDDNHFYKNQFEFYWNYVYNNKSKVSRINSNHTDYVYSYDTKNKIVEWVITAVWDSSTRRYFAKYNKDNFILEESEYGLWTKKYTQEKDTINIVEYFYHPTDTVKTYFKEAYSKGKIVYESENGYGMTTKKYSYFDNGRLKTLLKRVSDKTIKDHKTEYTYYATGILKQIQEYELENDHWTLKKRIDFEVNGSHSILSKKEKNRINQSLILSTKNWL